MKITRVFLILLATTLFWGHSVQSSFAAEVTFKGNATIKYKEYSDEVEEKGQKKALKSILKKVRAKFNKTQKRLYSKHKKEFVPIFMDEDHDDAFITGSEIAKEKNDEKKRRYKVTIRATVDMGAIDAWFIDKSDAGQQEVGDGSSFAVLFYARTEVSRQAYLAKKARVSSTENVDSLKEESGESGGKSMDVAQSKTLSATKTGGSTTTKADNVVWQPNLALSKKAQAAVVSALNESGFTTKKAEMMRGVQTLEELLGQIPVSGRLPTKIQKEYYFAMEDSDVDLFGIGFLDVGAGKNDPARGKSVVTANITFDVMTSEGETLANVPFTPVRGSGTNQGEARVKAINAAAALAMQTVVAKLQQKGIR